MSSAVWWVGGWVGGWVYLEEGGFFHHQPEDEEGESCVAWEDGRGGEGEESGEAGFWVGGWLN